MEKTIVTNPSVTESGEKPLGEGQNPTNEKELENRIRENLRGEYARKQEDLSEKLDEANERIEELSGRIELSKSQAKELNDLKGDKSSLERKLQILDSDPEYEPYRVKIERAKESAKSEAKNEILLDFMKDHIREEATKEGIKYQDLYNELNDMASDGRYGTLNPLQRAKALLRDRAKEKQFLAREEDVKKKEAEISGRLEGQGRQARDKSIAELEKEGDTIGMAKKLGL